MSVNLFEGDNFCLFNCYFCEGVLLGFIYDLFCLIWLKSDLKFIFYLVFTAVYKNRVNMHFCENWPREVNMEKGQSKEEKNSELK